MQTGYCVDNQDKGFLNIFVLVIGFLILVGILLFIISHVVSSGRFPTSENDPLRHALVTQRLTAVGDAYVGSVPASAKDVSKTTDKSSGAAPPQSGQAIWEGTCAACHQTGVAGAPKMGDKQEWAKHLAKGLATLKDHAINGYHGPEGFMPPRGANPTLSDAQVTKAMKYMVGKSGGQSLLK